MIYPKFLHKNDTIGICAPSHGVGDNLEGFESSIHTLKKFGYQIKETAHVRVNSERGGTAKERGEELTSLFADNDVKLILAAAGGDFLNEILPYVDWKILKNNPKWFFGASDPTGILYPLTTGLDIASLYGGNASQFDPSAYNDFVDYALHIIKGDLPTEHASKMHAEVADFLPEYNGLDTPTVWKSNHPEIHAKGRCIGGCIDVLKDLIGTRYDHTLQFIEKYKKDGVIWYFDNFSMTAENFYRTLCQFRYASWFSHTKAVMVGRVLFPSSETGMSYGEALEKALPDIPYIYEADIGHTKPSFTMINGAMMLLDYQDGRGSLSFQLDQ